MAKFPPRPIAPVAAQQLLVELCRALAAMRSPNEMAHLIADLLGPEELTMIAKRLAVARQLITGVTYQHIEATLHVSHSTVARVNLWLRRAGEGYRLAVQRTKSAAVKPPRRLWRDGEPELLTTLKRRLPLTFWPYLLLQEIVEGASVRQRNRLQAMLRTLARSGQKPALYRHLEPLLRTRGVRARSLASSPRARG